MDKKITEYSQRIEKLKASLATNYLQISHVTGIPVQNFYNITNGKNKLSPKMAKTICDAYPQISFDWLMFGEGEMFKKEVNITSSNVMKDISGGTNTQHSHNPELYDKVINLLQQVNELQETIHKLQLEIISLKQENERLRKDDHQV